MTQETTIAAPAAPVATAPAVVAPAETTAAPAPAALTIGEPAAPAASPPAAPVGAVQYEATGDPGLDMALDFVGSLGLGPNDPVMVAAGTGNFDLIKAKLAGMGDKAKGWERYVALAERAHTDGKAAADAKLAADQKVIFDAVGGEENWKAISQWAGQNAEPAEKEAVNAALKQGGLVAKVMAGWLASKFNANPATVKNPATVQAPNASPNSVGQGPLTSAQYSAEVEALRSRKGYGFESSPEYQSLQARRLAALRAGR